MPLRVSLRRLQPWPACSSLCFTVVVKTGLLSFLFLLPCLPRLPHVAMLFLQVALGMVFYHSNRKVAQHWLFISMVTQLHAYGPFVLAHLGTQLSSGLSGISSMACRGTWFLSIICPAGVWLLFFSIPGWPQYQICVSEYVSDFQTYNSSWSFIFGLIYLTSDLTSSWMSNKYLKSTWPKLNFNPVFL